MIKARPQAPDGRGLWTGAQRRKLWWASRRAFTSRRRAWAVITEQDSSAEALSRGRRTVGEHGDVVGSGRELVSRALPAGCHWTKA